MQNAVWLMCITGTLALFVAHPRWGGLAYIVAVLLAPYGVFYGGDVSIRADLVLTPLMLVCQFLGLSRTRPNASLVPIIWLFLIWLIWIGMTTLVSDREFNLVSANGYVRLVMVMIVLSWIPWRVSDIQDYQFVYVMTSIPIGLLSVGQILNIPAVRSLSDAWYSPPNAVVMSQQADAEQLGTLYRAVGVFGNVSPAATYFLLTVCLTVSLYTATMTRARRRWLTLALGASISGGLATLSATFVGGVLLTVLIAIFNSHTARRRKIIFAAAGCLAVLAIIVAFARSNIEMVDAQLDYQWERILGGELFANRYSSDEGVLADAFDEFSEHFLSGVGWTISDTFSGDSMYMALLCCAGIIGCAPLMFGMARLTMAAFRNKPVGHWALSWTAIMLLGGIGCTSLLTGRLADGWWAMQGMLISQLAVNARRHSTVTSRAAIPSVQSLKWQPKPKQRRPGFTSVR